MRADLGIVLAAALFATACSTGRPAADPPAQLKAVRMGTVSLSREGEPAKYSAILTPNSQVDLAFRVSGYVVWLYQTAGADGRVRPLEPGEPVTSEMVLARVRSSDYIRLSSTRIAARNRKRRARNARDTAYRPRHLFDLRAGPSDR